jgi:pimeloyl-ACP methyl ester carboxylesterase
MKWARIAAFAAMAITAGVSSAQPASFSVVTKTTALGHEDVSVDVYRPQQFDSIGVAVLAHGFTRDRLRDRDLARALASAGIVAVAPDLPSAVNLIGNGDAVAGLVADLERGTLGIAPTPRARIVLIGTSAGGLATVIAASQLPGLAGWIGLDPVDGTWVRRIARTIGRYHRRHYRWRSRERCESVAKLASRQLDEEILEIRRAVQVANAGVRRKIGKQRRRIVRVAECGLTGDLEPVRE